ncbi:metalloregulator ArsR/SmtB family transcription factor [Enhydrobacter sp.]|jgi:DNA-binding transcriptional ArsR family regulator|uniref:ArsR/SmtB family transcription factor n=1 Tax=Enhydrobacter sp. TaxID=1894999 RepID=UPI002630484A|nr:metalloregulator ArsR/SmtB family transcription factor [Enhydrobacter sp.]WIM09168.1 MAG: Arsenical resistance operon repressor [Enhydrobacter sp.]
MESIEAVAALGALAQENRLEVFRLLVQAGPEGLPAGQIAERLKLASPTLSFHLAQLRHAGLVTAKRDGRSLIYAADYDGMDDLMSFLTENCCGGKAEGCGIPACEPASRTVIHRRTKRGASRQ